MGEIRLICPGCNAEYRLAETAIPAKGRQVECTACGHVWFAPGKAGASAPTPTQPALNRPLPDDVLSILREEAAREHQARAREVEAADDTGKTKGAVLNLASAATDPDSDVDWPATTVTDAVPAKDDTAEENAPETKKADHQIPPPKAKAGATGGAMGAIIDSQARHIHDHPGSPPKTSPPEELAETVTRTTPSLSPASQAASTTEKGQPTQTPSIRKRRHPGYYHGFQWGLLLALAALTLYVAAPFLADQGRPGAALMEARSQIDSARLWLFDNATALIDLIFRK